MNRPILWNTDAAASASALAPGPQNRLSLDDIAFMVEEDIAGVEDLWRRFERYAVGHVFQSFDCVSIWHAGAGRRTRTAPRIVIGWGPDGEVLFLLPLGIRRKFGIAALTWLGGVEAGFKGGLFDAGFLAGLDAPAWAALWARIRALLPRVDLVHLADQPERLGPAANPFLLEPSREQKGWTHRTFAADAIQTFSLRHRGENRSAPVCDAEPAALHWRLIFRERFYYLVCAYDPQFAEAPGTRHREELLSWCLRRGSHRFGFDTSDPDYKYVVCEGPMALFTTIEASTWKGRVGAFLLGIGTGLKRRIMSLNIWPLPRTRMVLPAGPGPS